MLNNNILKQLKHHNVFLAVMNHDLIYCIKQNDASEPNDYIFSISECKRPPFSVNSYFREIKEIKPIIANMEHAFRFYDWETAKKTNINFTFNINEELEKRNLIDIAEVEVRLTEEVREQFPNMYVYVDNRWPVEDHIDITIQFEPR